MTLGREPCRVSDDPYYDYSDYFEQKGVYAPVEEVDEDAAYDEERQREADQID